MPLRTHAARAGALAIALLSILSSSAVARTWTVGVVRDGPAAAGQVSEFVEAEVSRLVESGTEVRFKSDPSFDAGWTPGRYEAALRSALDDPQVDFVLIEGVLVLEQAARMALRKPVLSASLLRADLFDIPRDEQGHSGHENLAFILSPSLADRDIRAFRQLIPFESLHFALGSEYVEQLDILAPTVEAYEDSLGAAITLVPVTSEIPETLSLFGEETEAVLLGATPRLSRSQRSELIDALTERRIPVFSLSGHADVDLGALAGISPDATRQVARRAALNIVQLTRGGRVDDLPVVLPVGSRLLLNAKTATAIGFEPEATVAASAEILFPEALESGITPVSMAWAMATAESLNVQLTISDATLDATRHDVGRSRSGLLPRIEADASYLDADPRTLEGVIPDRQTTVGLSVRQMIYDDGVVQDYRATKRELTGQELRREADRLDVLNEAGASFLSLVLVRLLYRIQADNVRLTEDNRDLAERRFEVGYSGRDEVFRWEAQLAQERARLLSIAAEVEAARIDFNQTLGLEQNLRWRPEEIEVDSDVLPLLDGRLDFIYDDTRLWDLFQEYMVLFAVENAPEGLALDSSIEGRGIQLSQRKRRWFLPRFDARLEYDYNVDREPPFEGVSNDFYLFEVAARYPLLEGGFRLYDQRRLQAEVLTLERQQTLTRDLVERRTRTAIRRASHSFPRIAFSRTAAENSLRNLEVVQEKYAQGIVNVTDLLEAQNQSLVASQNAAASVYEHLLDALEFQRSISWFEDDKTPEEKDLLVTRVRQAVGRPESREVPGEGETGNE